MSTGNFREAFASGNYREALETGTAEAAEAGRRAVAEYPLSTALSVFGLGVGVGLMLAMAMSSRHYHETSSQRISRQVLEGLRYVLPETVTKRFS